MDNYSSVPPPHANNPVDTQTAFADAVARARQIAEKLNQPTGNQQPPPQSQPPVELLGPQGVKRPYDDPLETGHHQEGSQRGPMEPRRAGYGGGPDAKKIAAINDPFGAQIRAMQEQQRSYHSQQAAQIAHDKAHQLNQKIHAMPAQRPPPMMTEHQGNSAHTCTEEIPIPNSMVGLVIGKKGETITKLQADSGCKVQIAQEDTGGADRPCALSGEPHHIMKAKQLIQEIVDTGRTAGNPMGDNEKTIEMMIPGSKVGLIIGKAGGTIKQMQTAAGVRSMVMIQDTKEPSAVEKPLRITGDPPSCKKAQELVMNLLAEKDAESAGIHRIPDVFQSMQSGPFSSGGGGNEYGGRGDGNKHKKEVIKIPKSVVGHVIGRGGETIKEIQQATNTKVQFQKDDNDDHNCPERACFVSGAPDAVKMAIEKIFQTISEKQSENRGGRRGDRGGMGHPGGGPDMEEETLFPVLGEKCGLVIGKGGESIRNIIETSGAHVELQQKNCPPDARTKNFCIRGRQDAIQKAIHAICRKVGMDPPMNMPGGPPGGPGGPNGMGGGPGMGGPGGPGGPPGGYDGMGPHSQQQPPPQQPPHQSGYNQPQGWQNVYGGADGGNSGWGQQQPPPQQPPPQQQQQQPPSGSGNTPVVEPTYNPVTGQRDYSAAWIEYYKQAGYGWCIEHVFPHAQAQNQGGGPSTPMAPGNPPTAGAPQQPNPPTPGAMPSHPAPPQHSAPNQYGQQQQMTSYPNYNAHAQQNQGQYGQHGGQQQYQQYGQYRQ